MIIESLQSQELGREEIYLTSALPFPPYTAEEFDIEGVPVGLILILVT